MTDQATPNLPSRDFDSTAAFYERLGFGIVFRDAGWMILQRGDLMLEFFAHPRGRLTETRKETIPEGTRAMTAIKRQNKTHGVGSFVHKRGVRSQGWHSVDTPPRPHWGQYARVSSFSPPHPPSSGEGPGLAANVGAASPAIATTGT